MIGTLIRKCFRLFNYGENIYHMMKRVFIETNNDILNLQLFSDKKILCLTDANILVFNKYNKKLLCKSRNENNNNNLEIISPNEFITYNYNSFILYHHKENTDYNYNECYPILRYYIPFPNYSINNIKCRKKNIICFGNNVLILKILKNYKIEIQAIIKGDDFPQEIFNGFLINDKNAIIIRNSLMIELWDIKYKYQLIKKFNNVLIDPVFDLFFNKINNNDKFFICNYRNIWIFSVKERKLMRKYRFNFPMRKIIISNKEIYGISKNSFCKYNSNKHKFIKTDIYESPNEFHNFIIDNNENILCVKENKIYHLIHRNIESILSEIIMIIFHYFGNLTLFKHFYFTDKEMTILIKILIFLFNPFFNIFIDFGNNFSFSSFLKALIKNSFRRFRDYTKEETIESGRNLLLFIFWPMYWIIYIYLEIVLTYIFVYIRLNLFNPLYKPTDEIPELIPLLSNSMD